MICGIRICARGISRCRMFGGCWRTAGADSGVGWADASVGWGRGARGCFAEPAEHGAVLQAPRSTVAVVQTGYLWAELLREGPLFAFACGVTEPGGGG